MINRSLGRARISSRVTLILFLMGLNGGNNDRETSSPFSEALLCNCFVRVRPLAVACGPPNTINSRERKLKKTNWVFVHPPPVSRFVLDSILVLIAVERKHTFRMHRFSSIAPHCSRFEALMLTLLAPHSQYGDKTLGIRLSIRSFLELEMR